MQENLRTLREKKRMTQEEMANILGLSSANAYSLKERGERRFTLDEARKISIYFGLPIEDIFFEKGLTIKVNNKKPVRR